MTAIKATNGNGTATSGNGSVPAWHSEFLRLVPEIQRRARALFRHLSRADREDAVAEVTAIAMLDYLGDTQNGEPAHCDAAALAASAVLHVRHSERACGPESSGDVLSPAAQRQRGFKVEPLKPSHGIDRLRARIEVREERDGPDEKRLQVRGARGNGCHPSALVQERSRRRHAEKRLDDHGIELESARRIQQRLFPTSAPLIPGFEMAGLTSPAAATGGDYYDYFPMLDYAVGVVVGDVSGHGFGPALLMATLRAYLRAFAQTHGDLGALVSVVNRTLTVDMEVDRFVTLVLVRLDPRNGSLVYASAGHPTGYVLNRSGQVRICLPSTGPLIGLGVSGDFAASPVLPLEPGELVILLSDGLTESAAPDGGVFGSARAIEVAGASRGKPPADIVSDLLKAVRGFSQGLPQLDDITAVVVKFSGRSKPDFSSS